MEMTTKRIQKEYENLLKDQLVGVHAEPTDPYDLYSWTASIRGPLETPYQGGVYHLSLDLPMQYPMKPPRVRFRTKIFHPNISEHG